MNVVPHHHQLELRSPGLKRDGAVYNARELPKDPDAIASVIAFTPSVRSWLFRVGLVASAAAISAEPAIAQSGPRVLTGVVKDSLGRPLENAVVSLDPTGAIRATRADPQGRFRFDNVSAGNHLLRTTWIGFRPDDRSIDMPNTGLDVSIVLAKLPFQLDTLVIVAKRTGIFGTAIDHSSIRPIEGATIEVMGAPRATARTTADGRFSFPAIREGGYVVRAERKDFKTRLISVPVPHAESVELALMLDSAVTKADKLAESMYFDFARRVHRRSVINSAIVPRHELAASRGMALDLALRYAPSYLYKALILVNDDACVYVDGRPAPGRQVRDFAADQVEMVEVYGDRGGGASMADQARFASLGQSACAMFRPDDAFVGAQKRRTTMGTVSVVYIWLRR